jgi:hypothetical protein
MIRRVAGGWVWAFACLSMGLLLASCSSNPCGEVCGCIGDEYGVEARDECRRECADLMSEVPRDQQRNVCQQALLYEGFDRCLDSCSAFPSGSSGGGDCSCGPGCDFCWCGTEFENACSAEWRGTDDGCDCGCQWTDPDC